MKKILSVLILSGVLFSGVLSALTFDQLKGSLFGCSKECFDLLEKTHQKLEEINATAHGLRKIRYTISLRPLAQRLYECRLMAESGNCKKAIECVSELDDLITSENAFYIRRDGILWGKVTHLGPKLQEAVERWEKERA